VLTNRKANIRIKRDMSAHQAVTEFIREAQQRIPTSEAARNKAILDAIVGGWYKDPGVMARASRLAGEIDQEQQRVVPMPQPSLDTNGLRALNRRLWASLEPKIKALRVGLFDSAAAPFDSAAAAAKWLEQETSNVKGERAGLLPYQKPGSLNVIYLPVPPASRIFDLHVAITEWAEDTGCAADALTMAVLNDVRVRLPAASTTFHYSPHYTSATIRLYAPDLTFRQLQRIFRHMREEWRSWERHPQSLLAADATILAIRDRLGPRQVPRSPAAKRYWKKFMSEAKRAGRPLETLNSARVALDRAERVERGERRTRSKPRHQRGR